MISMNVLSSLLKEYLSQKEETQREKDPDPWRPLLHLSPPTGFMNDPNGLCWFKGLWHVFFQYAPSSPEGGVKFWGHYTSPDLLHWTYWGAPLLPDQPFDCHGVYSGSALVVGEILHIFYSGNLFLDQHPPRAFSVVHVTSRDGFHFSQKEVVLPPSHYPEECSCQIRDPKVWFQDGQYKMVIGAQTRDGAGALLRYGSQDLDHWELEELVRPQPDFGYMWECPDIFTLEGEDFLSLSPQGIEAQEYQYSNIFQSVWTHMKDTPVFHYVEWDKGFDFYAPQTFLAPDGRRILYGWMGMDALAGYSNPTIAQGWQHALTLPRVITLREGQLYQFPVQELRQLRKSETHFRATAQVTLPCELQLECGGKESFTFHLGQGLHFSYYSEKQEARVFFTDNWGCGRTIRKAKISAIYSCQIWLDVSSAEIFLNQGETVFTTRFYPHSQELTFSLENGIGNSFTVWELSPITVERRRLDAQ